jgi:hypothetical protein
MASLSFWRESREQTQEETIAYIIDEILGFVYNSEIDSEIDNYIIIERCVFLSANQNEKCCVARCGRASR